MGAWQEAPAALLLLRLLAPADPHPPSRWRLGKGLWQGTGMVAEQEAPLPLLLLLRANPPPQTCWTLGRGLQVEQCMGTWQEAPPAVLLLVVVVPLPPDPDSEGYWRRERGLWPD
jgi:hypothetical protein